MTSRLNNFLPASRFLVCIDSDGCAIDTMNVKHLQCFGPCFIEEWHLEHWEKQLLDRWNEINLYSMTRGINRFKGLALILQEVDKQILPISGLSDFVHWTESATELSNSSLEKMIPASSGNCMKKALSWSVKVNAKINLLPADEKKAFANVKSVLASIQGQADVVIVSSANREAVTEEWERCGLLPYVTYLCCQDIGSKSDCIASLLEYGYDKHHVLMVGDAPGDLSAAEKNGIYFYPILVNREIDSWNEFTHAFSLFTDNNFSDYEKKMKDRFLKNLQPSTF